MFTLCADGEQARYKNIGSTKPDMWYQRYRCAPKWMALDAAHTQADKTTPHPFF